MVRPGFIWPLDQYGADGRMGKGIGAGLATNFGKPDPGLAYIEKFLGKRLMFAGVVYGRGMIAIFLLLLIPAGLIGFWGFFMWLLVAAYQKPRKRG